MNDALGAKLMWDMYKRPYQRWVQILNSTHIRSGSKESILTMDNPQRGSALLNFIVSCRSVIIIHVSWEIGDKRKEDF